MSSDANLDGDAGDAPATVEDQASIPAAGPAAGPAAREGKSALLAELLEADRREAVASARAPAPSAFGMRVGRFVEWVAGSGPTVEFPGNTLGPLPARSVIPLDRDLVQAAIADQRGVLLSFEDGKPDAPIVTGVLQPVELAQEDAEAEDESAASVELGVDPDDALEARVDGRRVEIEAADEIVLRCGKASIVLRRNGRVVIRGTYVETRSRGVNRIKGGSVEIN